MRKLYFALILCMACVCGLTSCDSSSQENLNTEEATVAFTSDTVFVKENKGLFSIPFKVTGNRNGMVKVNVSIIDNDSCKENQNFIITSKDINISVGKKTAKIECNTVDDKKINGDRIFIVKFNNVKGATIDNAASSVVIKLLDNDNTPYDRMSGQWSITARNLLTTNSQEVTWNVSIETADVTDSLNYGRLLTIKPFADGGGNVVNEYSMPMYFRWNEATKTGSVEIKMSELVGTAEMQLEDDDAPTSYTILTFSYDVSVKGEVNSELNKISIPGQIIGKLFKTEGMLEVDLQKGVAFGWGNMVLTRRE